MERRKIEWSTFLIFFYLSTLSPNLSQKLDIKQNYQDIKPNSLIIYAVVDKAFPVSIIGWLTTGSTQKKLSYEYIITCNGIQLLTDSQVVKCFYQAILFKCRRMNTHTLFGDWEIHFFRDFSFIRFLRSYDINYSIKPNSFVREVVDFFRTSVRWENVMILIFNPFSFPKFSQ